MASAKTTGLTARARFESGPLQVTMRRGRIVACLRKPNDAALVQHEARLHRAGRPW